ncbi:MAG: nuclear transport factor 2 family protein [Desulfobulbus sp.]|nr:nuclear transport factor 2 family protein [Desulfobulbus sp.]
MHSVAVETLLEERKIERVLIAYGTALDQRDWAALDDVLAPDATAHYKSLGHFASRAEMVSMFKEFLARCGTTQHMFSNMRIHVEGKKATAACYLQAIHVGLGKYQEQIWTVWGEYRDRLELRPEGWRIVHRELAVLHAAGDIGLAED